MNLLVFDIGGTFVKYNFWSNSTLDITRSFETPKTYAALKTEMKDVYDSAPFNIEGIAISAPGGVNPDKGEISGVSAVPYIHNIPLVEDLEQLFDLPVVIENDANCAGICEMELGSGQHDDNVVFLILGTGAGGALFFNRQLYRGSNFRSGEFGLAKNDGFNPLSSRGTVVRAAKKYSEIKKEEISGIDLFQLANNNDSVARGLVDIMYDQIASFIYNIQVALDLDLIIIGGGVSAQPDLEEHIKHRAQFLFDLEQIPDFMPKIKTAKFKNDSNLIGAALSFEEKHH